MDRWNCIDIATWLTQLSEEDAYSVWLKAHDRLYREHCLSKASGDKYAHQKFKFVATAAYNQDPEIKKLWKSALGRMLLGAYSVNSRILGFLRQPWRKIRRLVWGVRWWATRTKTGTKNQAQRQHNPGQASGSPFQRFWQRQTATPIKR